MNSFEIVLGGREGWMRGRDGGANLTNQCTKQAYSEMSQQTPSPYK